LPIKGLPANVDFGSCGSTMSRHARGDGAA